MSIKTEKQLIKQISKNKQRVGLTQQEARLLYYANSLRTQRTTCLIFFIGFKIKRMSIKKDVILLQEHGFCLELCRRFYITGFLKILFPKLPFALEDASGYSLFASTNKPVMEKQIPLLFNLPYRNMLPISILRKGVLYNKQREHVIAFTPYVANNASLCNKGKPAFSLMLGIAPIVIFNLALLQFLYVKLLRLKVHI